MTRKSSAPAGAPRANVIVAGLLTLATLVVYAQVARFDFVGLDDPLYVVHNPHVTGGLSRDGFVWAFTTTERSNWHPLTWLSLMLDAELGGSGARQFHLTNLALHLANGLLLYRLLATMTGAVWRSAVVALLFAVHPLHVESVAWVTERKDVLCSFFGLLSLWAWARWRMRRKVAWYGGAVVCYVLGLLAKPMLVTLPILLLLLDHWPLGTPERTSDPWRLWGRRVAGKLPFLGLAAASAMVTLHAQAAGGAMGTVLAYPIRVRLANAVVSCSTYLASIMWPVGLAVPYPYAADRLSGWRVAVATVMLATITAGAIAWRRQRPYLIVGWLWYLVMLVPVIGLVQVGMQSMADRYTYLPSIGVFLAIAWGVPDLLPRLGVRSPASRRVVLGGAATAVIVALAAAAHGQARHWRSPEALYRRALHVTEGNALAHHGLGLVLHAQGRFEDAVTHHTEAVRFAPTLPEAHMDLGASLTQLGRLEEALRHLKQARRLDPGDAKVRANLGVALLRAGRSNEAATEFGHALRLDRRTPLALNGLGITLLEGGRTDEARAHFEEAVRTSPRYAEAWFNLGAVLVRSGDLQGAANHFERALRLEPGSAAMLRSLALVRMRQGRHAEAASLFEQTLRLDPGDAVARQGLEDLRRVLPPGE